MRDKVKAAEKIEKIVAEVLDMDSHKWFTGNEPEEVIKARLKALEEFRKRYAD